MMNYYNSLSPGRDIWLKNGVGDSVGSPPNSKSSVTRFSWLQSMIMMLLFITGQSMFSQANLYSWATATGASLETITSPTVLTTVSTGTVDDGSNLVSPSGFTFRYNGVDYTQFSAATNGYVQMGNSTTNPILSSLNTGAINAVFVFGRDGNLNNVNGGSMTHGFASGGKYVFHFVKLSGGGSGGASATIYADVQVVLWGSTSASPGKIEIIWGTSAGTTSTSGAMGIVDAANTFVNGTNGNKVTATNSTSWPTSGSIFTFTPPPPCVAPVDQATALGFSATTFSSSTYTFTAASSSPNGYLVVRYPNGSATTNPTNGTAYTAGTSLGLGTVVSSGATLTGTAAGLVAGATYDFYVYTFNNAACSGGNTYNVTSPTTAALTTPVGSLSGTFTVGPTGTYPSLTAAFAAINTSGLAGNVDLQLQAAYVSTVETFPIASATAAAGAGFTIKVYPEAGATGLSITSANTTGTFNFNGAGKIIIDGRANQTGPSQLTISNTNLGASYAIQFVNDAVNNTVQYCTITSRSNTATSGTIVFGAGVLTGNDGNTLDNNSIADGTSTPVNAIYSAGTSSAVNNSENVVTNNNISNYFSATLSTAGILLTSTGNSGWNISTNRLFQTANRIYTAANTHNGISVQSGSGYTISGNTIGFANASGTGTTNMIGNSVALTGSFPSLYTTTGTPNATRYIAINAAFTAGGTVSNIQGNTVAGFALFTSSGATTTNGIFCGINVTSGPANIGTTTGNTIGNTSGLGSIYTAATTAGSTVVGIYANSANAVTIQNNNIGGIDASGTTASTAASFTGIDVGSGAGNITISNNNIGSTVTDNIRTGYLPNGANLSNAGTLTSATGGSAIVGIRSAASGNTFNASSNTIQGIATSGTATTVTGMITSGTMTGTTPSCTVDSNLLGTASLNWIRYAFPTSGTLTGISVGNTVATSHSVQSNNIRGIAYTSASTNSMTLMNFTGGTAANNVSTVSNNSFTNLNVNTTGSVTFISHTYTVAATGTQTINNNSIVTAFNKPAAGGTITGLTSNGSSALGSICNHTNNNFSNITSTGSTAITGVANTDGGNPTRTVTGNTFSNWTTGTGAIIGMSYNFFGGASTVSNNTVTNLNGQGAITGMNYGATGAANPLTISNNTITSLLSTVTGGNVLGLVSANGSTVVNINNNTINTLSSVGANSTVLGIDVTGATNTSVFLNTVNGLSTSGATSPIVIGIRASSGTLVNLHRNKVYGLSASAAIATTNGAVSGIVLAGGTTVNTFNNLVGGLTAPAAVLADAIRGIAVTSTSASTNQNVYNNTVRLDASSSGATFGTSGVFHAASATATTGTLNLRNNIIINLSTPAGATGVVTALRRSAAATLGNYGATSNKNLLYAGTPSATNTIMYDGTTAYSAFGPAATAGTYQNAVATRDAGSFTGEAAFDYSAVTGPTQFFQSITGSDANFLHNLAGITSQVEGGADAITPLVALDYDGDTRTATPDLGADEFVGTSPSPIITALSTPTSTCSATAHVVTANVVPTSGTLTDVTLNYNNGAPGSVAMTLVSGDTYTGTIPAASPSNTTVTWSVSATNSIGTSASQSGTSYSDDPNATISLVASSATTTLCEGGSTVLSALIGEPTYTAPTAVTNPASDEDLSNVTISQGATVILNNTSARNSLTGTIGTATGTAGSYSNFTGFGPYTLNAGQTYDISLSSLQSGGGYTNIFGVWIDYNRNGVFTDAGEQVFVSTSGAGDITRTGSFTVPALSGVGLTRMRVLNYEGSSISGPTMTVGYGEFEEYAIQLSPTALTYTWSDGVSTVGTGATLSVSPTATTTYTVTTTFNSCPKTSAGLTINVNPLPTAPTATNSNQCGEGIPTGAVADPNGFTTPTYKWYTASTGGSAVQSSTSTTYTASISTSNTFYVSVTNPTTGCESTRTQIDLNVTAPDTIAASASNTNICLGSSVDLIATTTSNTNGNVYAFTWSAAAGSGISTSVSGGSGTFGSPTTTSVTPTIAGTYVFTLNGVDSTLGCNALSSTISVTVNALPTLVISPSSASVCEGSPVTLTAQTNIISAGTATVGAATTLSSSTGYPTAFGDYWYQDWQQYVYTAAELNAAGLVAGNITSLAFNIGALPSSNVSNYNVKIGTTANSTLTGFTTTGLTNVYGPALYTATTGINTIPFSAPFAWDGTSNIIVDVRGTGTFNDANATTSYTTTTGNTVVYAYTSTNNTNFWTSSPTATTSTSRPNISFAGQTSALGLGTLSYEWNDPLSTSGNVLTVTPSSTTTYTVTGTTTSGAICANTASVVVTVNPLPTAPTTSGSLVQCGASAPVAGVLSVADTNAFTTPTFKWYSASTGGTLLQSSTATTYNNVLSAFTTLYVSVVNPTTLCESARTSVSVDVLTADPITLSNVGPVTICLGNAVGVSASSANLSYVYTWTASPSTGSGISGSASGAAPSITPTAAGTYVYTIAATDGNCSTLTTLTVTVSPVPVFASVTATPAAVCANGIATLNALIPASYSLSGSTETYTPITGTALTTATQDDSGVGNLPIGFTFSYNGVDETVFAASTNGFIQLGNTTAAITGFSANALASNAKIIAPFWDDNNMTGGDIQYLTTGTSPNRVLTVQWTGMHVGGSGSSTNPTISCQARLYENNSKIEFVYGPQSATLSSPAASVGISAASGSYRSVTPLSPIGTSTVSTTTENTSVTGANIPSGSKLTFELPVLAPIVWSPTTDLYIDAAATIAYTGTPAAKVYSKPSATIEYTATATLGSCPTSQKVTVTQNNEVIDAITGGATSACLGSPTIPTLIDFDSSVGVDWVSSVPGVATIDVDGIVTLVGPGTTVISASRLNGTTGCTSAAPNTVTLNVYAPLAITTNPAAFVNALAYDPLAETPTPTATTFTAAASGSVASVQWEVSTSGNPGTWTAISNGNGTDPDSYTGATTNVLTIHNATTASSGLFYHAVYTSSSPCTPATIETTNSLLTVSDLVISDPANVIVCGTDSASFTTSVVEGPPGVTFQWYYSTDAGVTYNEIDGSAIDGVTFPGTAPDNVTGTTLVMDGVSSVNAGWYIVAVGTAGSTSVVSNPAIISVAQPAIITTPLVADQTVCSTGGASTFTVAQTGGTVQWQYSNDDVTYTDVVNSTPTGMTYTNATTNTLTVTTSASAAAGPHYFKAKVTSPTGCPVQYSNKGELIINTPTVNVNGDNTFICNPGGTGITLTASGTAASYSWSPATGLSATTGSVVTANPTSTTTYVVTGTETLGCTNTASFTVTVGAIPVATATATASTICPGENSVLSVTTPAFDGTGFALGTSSTTYTPITGTTLTTTTQDDSGVGNLPIGFTFNYNGVGETVFAASTNGFIRLGITSATISGGSANALSSTNKVIAPFWDDNNMTGGSITYATTGTAPNRKLTVQWTGMHVGGGGSATNPTISCQAILNENGSIELVYGPTSAALSSPAASVGISTATGTFKSVTPLSPLASSTASVSVENTSVGATNLPSGSVLTFTPVPVYAPVTYTYAWSPSTFISGQENSASPTAIGVTETTTYSCLITSSVGCSTTVNTTVTVQSGTVINTQPVATTACQGTTATFTVAASGQGLIYQWRKGGVNISGNASAATATLSLTGVTAADMANYSVLITPTCGSPLESDAVALTVTPSPTVTAPAAWPSTVCAGTTTTAITLNGSVGATFNITGGAAIGLANQTGVSAIPSFTGIAGTATLVITPVFGTCTGTAINYAVTIQALPTTVTVAPATATICSSDVNAILLTGNGGIPTVTYCTPTTPSQPGASGDYLQDFTFANITNNGTTDAASDYTYYNLLTANVVADGTTTYPISLKAGGASSLYAQQFRIWIDFNQNGVFETSESVFATTTATFSPTVATGSITIPNSALNGTTRMRVASRYNSAVADTESCSHSSYGEYEDYNVSITGGTAPTVQGYTWTSTGGGLYTDAAATVAYTGTTSATVYAKPSATATITATYTNAAGCTAAGTSVITVNNATTWYADADNDTFGDIAVSQLACTQPVGYVANNTDCDPTDGTKWQFATFYVDTDADGYDLGSASVCSGATAPSGYSATTLGTDCNDTDPTKNSSYPFYVDGDLDGYGAGSSVSVCAVNATTPPAGYSLTNDDCDDTNALLNPTNPCSAGSVVNLTLFVQGYYAGGSTMTSVKLNQDYVSPDTDVEDMTVELHDALDYSLVDTAIGTLKTDGTLSVTFNTAAAGSYYIAVKGSNLVQTWSAEPQTIGTTPLAYDFSTSASQAYGDNMIEVETGVFAMYQGDFEVDDLVDTQDYPAWEIKYLDGAFGVEPTDLNGDGLVDTQDYTIWEINYLSGVFASYPF